MVMVVIDTDVTGRLLRSVSWVLWTVGIRRISVCITIFCLLYGGLDSILLMAPLGTDYKIYENVVDVTHRFKEMFYE